MSTPHGHTPCAWAPIGDPLYRAYHDTEWGVPEWDPRALWEKLILDGFQAGLAWITILRKRESLREAFDGFEPEAIARYEEADIVRLLANPGVIRSRAKIQAAIKGAQIYLSMQDKGQDFAAYLWDFVDGAPVQNAWSHYKDGPTATAVSTAMAKDLKAKGFKFCGPVISHAFMQATGMVNDHETCCPRWRQLGGGSEG